VLIQQALPGEIWPWVAYAGAIAAVNADTWATELGVLNPTPPRLVTTWHTVERGASGGVSALGSLASLGGALLAGGIASLFPIGSNPLVLIISAVLGGLSGSFFDSLLGATVQSIYWCPNCQKETERYPLHICGTQTSPLRGWRWLDNDRVNFIASLVGAVVGLLVYLLAT
jgi:uncharacterized protein (TIGR00297 family)